MKTKLMTLLIVALGCFAINAHAQNQNESGIKVLPTGTPGVIKVLHAASIDKSVSVTFLDEDGRISTDRISGPFPKGVMKRYDVSHINEKNFLVQVSSIDMTVTYRVSASKDKKKYTPILEKVEYHNQVVASR
jgi:hypothetical protein